VMRTGTPAKLSPSESLALGVALALNCLAAAFGVGMSGISPLLVGLFVGGFSFLSVGIGNVLGLKTGKKLNGGLLSLLSAIAMMGLGILQIFPGFRCRKMQSRHG
ncbi:MAG: hypothetical protein ACLRQ4_23695, partial [Neglectibacter timonensis]